MEIMMGKVKLKPISKLLLPIKKNDYVLYNKELYKVIMVNHNTSYFIQHVATQEVVYYKSTEFGIRSFIYASDLTKIESKAARILYGL